MFASFAEDKLRNKEPHRAGGIQRILKHTLSGEKLQFNAKLICEGKEGQWTSRLRSAQVQVKYPRGRHHDIWAGSLSAGAVAE
jgi:hypothetical protein